MAYSVVSTSNTGIGGTTGSVTITKPTGLEVADLLIALLESSQTATVGINTASGWTPVDNENFSVSDEQCVNIQYKIADASDVAAANFTFTDSNGTARMCGALLRVTGHPPTSPVDVSDSSSNDTADSATLSFSVTITPAHDGSLLVMLVAGGLSGSGVATVGSYQITGPGNPTWTEVLDTSIDSGTQDPVAGAAYAILATAAQITAYGATFSQVRADHGAILAIFKPQVNASGTAALLSAAPTIFAPTASVGTTGTNALLEASPTIFAPTAEETSPSDPWANEDLPDTDWENEPLP